MKPPSRKRRAAYSLVPQGSALAADAFSQLALWTSANLAGMVTGLLLAREPFFRKLIARVGGRHRTHPRPSHDQSLPMLAEAVMGSSKALIAEVFGPPRSAVVDDGADAKEPVQFWQANTWYYPLPRQGPLAMAINFSEGFAHRVEFFQTPHAA